MASRKFEQTFGLSEDEVIGKLPHDLYPAKFADHTRKHDLKVLRQGKLIYQEDVVPGSDPPITLLASKFPITSETGEINGIGTISVDISDRKRIEQALLTQSQIVTNMVESAILTRVSDKTILYTNPSTKRVFGFESEELVGQPFSILKAPTDKRSGDKTKGLTEALCESGRWHGELRYTKKDKSEFWCSVNILYFPVTSDRLSIALDDFGSGLSSFGYLKNLKVDFLKIDGMFVKDIVDDPIDRAMVKSINEIGQIMGMKTIAEFVENTEIRQELEKIGVNYGQGYGLGKPTPLQDVIQFAHSKSGTEATILQLHNSNKS